MSLKIFLLILYIVGVIWTVHLWTTFPTNGDSMLTSWIAWLGKHPKLVALVIVGVVILLALAMWLGRDLSWIPGILRAA